MFNPLPRRTVLRAAGVGIALPALECMSRRRCFAAAPDVSTPRRMVAINFELSFYPPNLIPTVGGTNYPLPRYLQPLEDMREEFTVISGTSHPEVDGGHAASKSWLTGAPHPGAANFKNSISIDQLAAKQLGLKTRFASLAMGSGGISITDAGVTMPTSSRPSSLFRRMFVEGRPDEKARQIERLQEGQSVLDTVLDSANRLKRRLGQADKSSLDEYFASVREAERMLHKSEQWQHRPKPKVDAKPPQDITDKNRIVERAKQYYEMMFLAIQSDSTRLITFTPGDGNSVAALPGVSMNYHDLSHHGKDPEKLKQLAIIEAEHIRLYGDFIRRLSDTPEQNSSLLDRTMVLLGSHMHDGRHDNRNLPILLSGGGFKHGQHLQFDSENNYPLANLYVSMLQRLGLPIEQFASSTGTMTGLEFRG